MRVGRRTIEVSNRDKVFFPAAGVTKGDVIDYYADLADVMVPHMRHYGDSMQRFPDGLQDAGFYNKDTPDYFPDWIPRITVPKREGGSFDAPIVDSKAALVYMANQAVLTHHLYLSRADDLERPDKMIYDLDPPPGADFDLVREAALALRGILRDVDLDAWVQTTGSKGLHVVVPIKREPDFDMVRTFARDVATILVSRQPNTYTLEQRKKKREGRVFLDVLRNAYGATAVAPYSVRALPGAPVATPLDWDEVHDSGLGPQDWGVQNVRQRLGQRQDPWHGMQRHARSLGSRREKLDRMLD